MAEDASERPVVVTGEQRVHPAIRKLARACIALARLLVTGEQPTTKQEAGTSTTDTGDQEQAHD